MNVKTDKFGPLTASFACYGLKGVVMYVVSAVWIALTRRLTPRKDANAA